MEWVNFREVRDKVSLETVLFDFYGIEGLTRIDSKVVGPCPVHGGDSPRAFHAELDRNLWHCFSRCKGGGNQLDFVARREGITIREAALLLKRRYLDGQTPRDSATRPAPPKRATSKERHAPEEPTKAPSPARMPGPQAANDDAEADEGNAPLDLTLNLKAWHPHLIEDRKLAQATIEHFGVGYCSMGILRGMIAIPVHDSAGSVVAYAGRRLKPTDVDRYGKYKFPKGFRKELELYNYHRAAESMAEDGLILVEGFFSVMKLHEAGFLNVVASMGCEVSQAQLDLLARAPDVLVLFDGDTAGRDGAARVREALKARTRVRVGDLPDGFEPEALGERGLRWLVRGIRSLDLGTVSLRLHSGPGT